MPSEYTVGNQFWEKNYGSLCIKCIRVFCLLTNYTMIDDLEIVTLSYVVYFGFHKRY